MRVRQRMRAWQRRALGPLYDFRLQSTHTLLGNRRTGTGSFTDSSGNNALTTETAPGSGLWLPRIQHSATAPHVPLGTLIEPQATQLLPKTQDFADAAWAKSNVTVATSSVPSKLQGVNATKLLESGAGTHTLFVNSFPLSAGLYTLYFVAKAAEREWVYVRLANAAGQGAWFNLSTAAVGTVEADTAAFIEPIGDGWCLCAVTRTLTSSTWFPQINIATADATSVYVGDGTSGVYLSHSQLEAGSVATSYIPNPTTGSLVRSADGNWDITGAQFTELWGTGSERTIIVEWYDVGSAVEHGLVMGHVAGSVVSEALGLFVTAANALMFHARAGGTVQASLNAGTINVGTLGAPARNKAAFRWGAGAFGVSLNGAAELTGTGTIPVVTHLRTSGTGLVAANAVHDILTALDARPTAITGSANSSLSAL